VAVAAAAFLGLFSVAGPLIPKAAASLPSGWSPADLQSAYSFPSATQGVSQTVAVVTSYDDSAAEADLGVYRTMYGLAACTSSNGCFKKVDLSAGVAGSSAATAQALDAVSAVCPNCHITLVEARSSAIADVGVAVDSAVALGVTFVATTAAIPEAQVGQAERNYDGHFNHPGVVITAPSGDRGYGVSYPAASPYVVAVGGTVLTQDSGNSRGWDEAPWSSSGSGCSAYETNKQPWQTDSAQCADRTLNDIAAVATNVAYYDTPTSGGWNVGAGTEVSAAIIAAAYALAGTPANDTYPASYLYGNAQGLLDLTSGSNGTCAVTYWCTAGPGYDGPTGLGTPDGVSAFLASYYQPVTPFRVMDTRNGNGGITGPVGAGSTVELAIAGQHGIPVANVTAVVLNLVVTAQTNYGYLRAYADGVPVPTTSVINFQVSGTASDLVIVPVGTDGIIDFYNGAAGTAQLVGDVSGYFTSDVTAGGNESYTPMTPVRILDTRNGIGAPKQPLANGVTLTLPVGGANGIPAGISDVAINFTALHATSVGWLNAWQDGTAKPGVSGLQFQLTASMTGLAIVHVASNGDIDVSNGYSTTNSVDVIGDVIGYFTAGTAGASYHVIDPVRMIDTKASNAPIAANGTQAFPAGSPITAPSPTLASNLQGKPAATGYLVAYPATIASPGNPAVNFTGTQETTNLAFTPTGNGSIDISNVSAAANNVINDAVGYFSIG
jgi:hypothetical protein